MGIKSNYFRHSFNAHLDTKIRSLIQRKGHLGYAVYFVLLEIYCRKIFDDDKRRIDQEVDLKLMGSYLGVRSDSVHSCLIVMEELELICHLSSKYDQTMVKLRIPKSLKYFGRYENVSDEKIPKEKKVKEKKIKESKVKYITEVETSTSEVREAYKKSYFGKYGIDPVWSVKENSLAKKLVASIGADEAKRLAMFYPTYSDKFHSSKKHPFGLLVSQVDQVRVAMIGHVKVSSDYGNPYTKMLREMDKQVEVQNG